MFREISERQFNAFCYVRQPMTPMLSEEVGWYEAFNRKLIAIIIRDKTDNDFGYIVLGRDARNLFRALEVSTAFYETPDEAITALKECAVKYENDGQENYPQGDEEFAPNDILELAVNEDRLHPYFKVLTEEPRYEAARNLIKEIVHGFHDIDGNYIEQFQSTAFDARLWELYLYMYLYQAGFGFDNSHNAPDYNLMKLGVECCIEAVTVNSSPTFDEASPKTAHDILELTQNYMPIKFGSPLYSKLQKKYWEKKHVAGKPFILAIHDYHQAADKEALGSMTWSRSSLHDYLYGYRTKMKVTDKGLLVPDVEETEDGPKAVFEKIERHKWKNKEIPSGFFNQPETENISAVLFSNAATITTFNRMGKLAGLGSKDIKMIRMGFRNNPHPDAILPIQFVEDVDDPEYSESWSDGLVMYHNPNALQPIDPILFPDITHILLNFVTSEHQAIIQPFDVLSSITMVLQIAED